MALEIRPNAIAQDQGPFFFPGVYIGPGPYPETLIDGRLGIGTAVPDGPLHIFVTDVGAVTADAGADDLIIEVGGSGVSGGISIMSATDGIGRINFGDMLGASAGSLLYEHSTDILSFRSTAVERWAVGAGATVFNESGADTDFRVESDGNENMLVVNGGTNRVGIGILAPDSTFHVDAPGTTNVSLTFGTESGQIFQNENSEFAFGLENTSPFPLYIQGRTSSDGSRAIVINPLGGNVGIGLQNPGATLAVEGDAVFNPARADKNFRVAALAITSAFLIDGADGGIVMQNLLGVSASTDVNINGSNELHKVTSSKRFKKYIKPIQIPLSSVYELRPRSFTWRKGVETAVENDFGLIAEEVADVIPELVNYDEEGLPYSIRTALVPVLMLQAVLDLNERVSKLEAA